MMILLAIMIPCRIKAKQRNAGTVYASMVVRRKPHFNSGGE